MKELKLEELSTRQKLGMTFTAFLNGYARTPEEDAFIVDMIKNHSLGCVWIQEGREGVEELVSMVKEAADYPILIITDAENGIAPYTIGRHNAVACTGDVKYAYTFGKTVGVMARKMGYTAVCNPILDMYRGSQRTLGNDKEKVAAFAKEIARGMHDGGILTVGKHFPGAPLKTPVDGHMAPGTSGYTKEDIKNRVLYPYKRLMEEDLLDGIMTSHKTFDTIDPEHPASLSKAVIDIIREEGFDGFATTDALCMMAVRSRFNDIDAKGLAIAAGNDTILPWGANSRQLFDEYCQAYDKGLIPDERLDDAARRILEAQHKSTLLPKDAELTDEDIRMFNCINRDSIYEKVTEGEAKKYSHDGKYCFAVMIRSDYGIGAEGHVEVDTFSSDSWRKPMEVKELILKKFPNSTVMFVNEFPAPKQNHDILNASIACEDTIFLTFSEYVAYTGSEFITRRFIRLVEALQVTNKISAIIHQGNPFVCEELPHVPRWIIGHTTMDSLDACLDVLAGDYPAKGAPTYDFKLK